MAKSVEYIAWENMIQRCTNERFKQYARYGGRGITVSPLFRGSGGFQAFVKEVGPRPSAFHSLDRRDNERGYEPGNLRWATREEQNRNTSKNRFLTVGDRTMTVSEWSRQTGIPISTLRLRIRATPGDVVRILSPSRNPRRATAIATEG